jgi:hypothetical protein
VATAVAAVTLAGVGNTVEPAGAGTAGDGGTCAVAKPVQRLRANATASFA